VSDVQGPELPPHIVLSRTRAAGAAVEVHDEDELYRIAELPRHERRAALGNMRRAYRRAKRAMRRTGK